MRTILTKYSEKRTKMITRTRTRKRMRTIAGMRMWIATRRRRMRISGTSRVKQGLAK